MRTRRMCREGQGLAIAAGLHLAAHDAQFDIGGMHHAGRGLETLAGRLGLPGGQLGLALPHQTLPLGQIARQILAGAAPQSTLGLQAPLGRLGMDRRKNRRPGQQGGGGAARQAGEDHCFVMRGLPNTWSAGLYGDFGDLNEAR